jgi:hypothetical protein
LLDRLKQAGFSDRDLSVILPDDKLIEDPKIALDHKPGTDPADEKPRGASEKVKGLPVGAVSGGLILGAVGGLIGLASLAIPGLGFVMVGGPIAAMLADATAGGAAGAIAGALIGLRIPEHRAREYEKRLACGSALISVHTQNGEELRRAMEILAAGGAEDLHEVIEPSAVQ